MCRSCGYGFWLLMQGGSRQAHDPKRESCLQPLEDRTCPLWGGHLQSKSPGMLADVPADDDELSHITKKKSS